jgi:hypothetical protein
MSETETAERVTEEAHELAAELREDGVVVAPRRTVNSRVTERGEFESISHRAVRDGFRVAGWDYDRHLYLDPDAVTERATAEAAAFRTDGRLLVTREEVIEAVAPDADRGDEDGWNRGRFVALLRDAFEDAGWLVERVERSGRERALFLRPLGEQFADHHPSGRPPLSADDLLRLYVARSLEKTV